MNVEIHPIGMQTTYSRDNLLAKSFITVVTVQLKE
jgi:hypothetical protein